MKVTRKAMLVLLCALGAGLVTSTTPTKAYNVVSTAEPGPRPQVGVLFSNSYNYYFFHHYYHVGKTRHAGREEPRLPAKFFDRK